ncbi:MAG: hypothetical protein HYX43_19810 [Burkholderiales bacterium]|nr:hypothetical protein [Burkholderiales bacterium]
MMQFSPLILAAALLANPLAAWAADSHDHGAAAPQKMGLNAGEKWMTDAPLRQAMTAMRASVAATLPLAHEGKATTAQFDALSQEVNAQVAAIVQNCKLDAKADAQLHSVIADLLSGAEVVEGKQPSHSRAAGVVQVAQGLNSYGKYFDHAGWKAIDLPKH